MIESIEKIRVRVWSEKGVFVEEMKMN